MKPDPLTAWHAWQTWQAAAVAVSTFAALGLVWLAFYGCRLGSVDPRDQIPSAGFIEAARDQQIREDPGRTARKLKELQTAAWQQKHDEDPGFSNGYLLGLKTSELIEQTVNEIRRP